MTNTQPEALKPCPFCGGSASTLTAVGEIWVKCDVCDSACAVSTASRDKAVAAWNTRVADAELTALRARAEAAESASETNQRLADNYLELTCSKQFEEALKAGDGTLHGAIDYWQKRAEAAEATLVLQKASYERELAMEREAAEAKVAAGAGPVAWADAAVWLRNNYQDHRSIAEICEALVCASPDIYRYADVVSVKTKLPGGRGTDQWESARVADFNKGWNEYRRAVKAVLAAEPQPAAPEQRIHAGGGHIPAVTQNVCQRCGKWAGAHATLPGQPRDTYATAHPSQQHPSR